MQQRGAGIPAGSSTAYTVTGLKAGTTYYFAVTAVDSAGNESALLERSDQTSAVTIELTHKV